MSVPCVLSQSWPFSTRTRGQNTAAHTRADQTHFLNPHYPSTRPLSVADKVTHPAAANAASRQNHAPSPQTPIDARQLHNRNRNKPHCQGLGGGKKWPETKTGVQWSDACLGSNSGWGHTMACHCGGDNWGLPTHIAPQGKRPLPGSRWGSFQAAVRSSQAQVLPNSTTSS